MLEFTARWIINGKQVDYAALISGPTNCTARLQGDDMPCAMCHCTWYQCTSPGPNCFFY